jgi:hypothetical protein
MGASTAGRAQPKSFDGAYKGTLECERGLEVFRSLLTINIRNGRVTGGARTLGIDGKEELIPGGGTVDADGIYRSGHIFYTRGYTLHADYIGMLSDTGGTLTGTQVFTRETTEDGGTRSCKGTFLKASRLSCRGNSEEAVSCRAFARAGKPAAMFVIWDEAHDERHGRFQTREEAVVELQRRAAIPWNEEPNRAPCTTWRNCGRRYELVECNDTRRHGKNCHEI